MDADLAVGFGPLSVRCYSHSSSESSLVHNPTLGHTVSSFRWMSWQGYCVRLSHPQPP